MYPPRHYQEKNFEKARATIEQFPLATLITVANNLPFVTHLPLFYVSETKGLGKLIGHIDLHNPQVSHLDGSTATVIFSGPNTYISPNTYASEKQLPTWNYIKVHISGTVKVVINESEVKKSLLDLTGKMEAHLGADFTLEPDNPKMNAYLPYIRAFEIPIEQWEGKFKLSQDKTERDKTLALHKLAADQKRDLSDYLNQMLQN